MSDAEIDNRTNWVNAILFLMIAVPIGLLIYQFTRPSPVVLKEKVATYRITGVNPPKHVYVSLIDVSTGEGHERVFVSKHFNDWREKLIVGRTVELKSQFVRDYRGKQYTRFVGLKESLRK